MPAATSTTLLSLDAVTTGTGSVLSIGGLYRNVTCYISSAGTISGGAITLEEAPASTYAGTWATIGSATSVPTSGNQVAVIRATSGAYCCVRARVSSTITGGGTASATIIATD